MRSSIISLASLVLPLALIAGTPLRAQETVSVGGSSAVLLRPAAPRASVILMPGGDGSIGAAANGTITRLQGNQLVRTRNAYLARGLAVLVVDAGTDLAGAVQYMAAIKRPVTVIATSRGTIRAAQGIARGARPDALVLTSGFLAPESGSGTNVMGILGSAANLPRTLVIHHRHDGCDVACGRRSVHTLGRRTRARRLARRRYRARRSVRSRGPPRLQRARWAGRVARGRLPLIRRRLRTIERERV